MGEKKSGGSHRYHFSLGDSTKGPVGFCSVVEAESEAEAVKKLKDLLPEEFLIHEDGASYVDVYFNPDAITEKDIDEIEEPD